MKHPKQMNGIEEFCPKDSNDWREWLEKNHQRKDAVWLIFYKTKSPKHNLSWSQAVDQALCFGWIDSVKKSIDNERFKPSVSENLRAIGQGLIKTRWKTLLLKD